MEGATARWYARLTGKEMEEFRTLARRIAAELPDGARILEVAPGPGYFAIELAKLGHFRITGLDVSHTFVDIARSNSVEAGVAVDFQQGNASALPFDDESFDFLLCRAAFKNFSEPVRALEEMHRVLAVGCRALIIDMRGDASDQSIRDAVDAMHSGPVNRLITRWTFRHMLLKRAYTRDEFARLVAQTKFGSARIEEDPLGFEVSLRR